MATLKIPFSNGACRFLQHCGFKWGSRVSNGGGSAVSNDDVVRAGGYLILIENNT